MSFYNDKLSQAIAKDLAEQAKPTEKLDEAKFLYNHGDDIGFELAKNSNISVSLGSIKPELKVNVTLNDVRNIDQMTAPSKFAAEVQKLMDEKETRQQGKDKWTQKAAAHGLSLAKDIEKLEAKFKNDVAVRIRKYFKDMDR